MSADEEATVSPIQVLKEFQRLQAMETRLVELLKNYGSPGLIGADTIRKAMKS